MKLKDYILATEMSVSKFSKAIGISQPTVNRYVRGERFPKPDHLITIRERTSGAVAWADWEDIYLSKAPSRPKPTHSGER